MQIKHFMVTSDRVVKAPSNSKLKEVASLMVDNHIGSVVLVDPDDEKQPVGILTSTDLVRERFEKNIGCDARAEDVMSKDLFFVRDNMEEGDVAMEMTKSNKHHVLVRDEKKNWVGISSSSDVLYEAALTSKSFPYARKLNRVNY